MGSHGYESGFVEWSLSICVSVPDYNAIVMQRAPDSIVVRLLRRRECFVHQEYISNLASEVQHGSGQTTILILPCIVRRPVDSRVETRLW